MPANIGSEVSSAAGSTSAELSRIGSLICATGLKVIALVGQETMHSPHFTQLDSPIGSLRSKPMPAVAPLPGPADDVVFHHLVAGAHAAVAENAGAVIDDEDRRGRIERAGAPPAAWLAGGGADSTSSWKRAGSASHRSDIDAVR